MSRHVVVGLIALMMTGCVRSTPPAAVALPLELPTQQTSMVSGTIQRPVEPLHDVADFSSDRGLVHLRAEGAHVSGTYSNGVILCTREASRLDCEWAESSVEGHASFVARADGVYDGTWGTGASATDGGAWTLTPIRATNDIEGVYDSNWGVATVTQTASDVHVDYGRGTMDCQRNGTTLSCQWTEGAAPGGGAELTIEPSGVLRGHWGSGPSSSDGGSWVFVKR